MNKHTLEGNWKQMKGKVKEQWAKLTDDDMTHIEGKRDRLVGKIQERYGHQRDEAEKAVDGFLASGNTATTQPPSGAQLSS